MSAIEWTDETWNPVTGCTKVSDGCDNCYAERQTERFHGPGSFERIVLHPERLDRPFHWRRPRKVFVNSMSDLFHERVPDDYIARVFAVMGTAAGHTFQVLTKRHGRMHSLLSSLAFREMVDEHWLTYMAMPPGRWQHEPGTWPLPNVWLGVSVEDQRWADIRSPALLETPAAVRFLSCEPLLGRLDIEQWTWKSPGQRVVDWVIVGGESGPGARPMLRAWAISLRNQCVNAEVPFLFKQWGAWAPAHILEPHTAIKDPETGHLLAYKRVGKKAAGRELDGRTWDEFPADLQAVSA